jgi:hypothetical protein
MESFFFNVFVSFLILKEEGVNGFTGYSNQMKQEAIYESTNPFSI